MRNSRKSRSYMNDHHRGSRNSKSTCWEGTKKWLIHLLKFKVSCNSTAEIPGCGLLYTGDSLINTSTVNQTEQKVSMYRNGQLCWSDHNALLCFLTLNIVFVSYPLVQIKHKNNLRGRDKSHERGFLWISEILEQLVVYRESEMGGLVVAPLGTPRFPTNPKRDRRAQGKKSSPF